MSNEPKLLPILLDNMLEWFRAFGGIALLLVVVAVVAGVVVIRKLRKS